MKVDPLLIGLLNLEYQQYLYIQHTLWMEQDRQVNYHSHMKSFSTVLLGFG